MTRDLTRMPPVPEAEKPIQEEATGQLAHALALGQVGDETWEMRCLCGWAADGLFGRKTEALDAGTAHRVEAGEQ